ncbi:hypothetical protein [Novosphingobium kaempferiae]|uniref:hypothetical protein n=1 Tax=Novosphingobium kaempferiae TaxID=2896849 RepID=UPI001E31A318|nr:hypothetical protein [Novosphingobium kaempferiae]
MMRRLATTMAALAMLAGCGEDTPAEKAADDAHDVAMVERMSREPFKPIVPIAITTDDIQRYGLDKPGCTFSKGTASDPLFIATRDEGYMRVGSDLKRFSARNLSADLPSGARTTYIGLSSWVDIVRQPDAGTNADADTWPARIIIHDAQERVAFRADGTMRCRT